MGQDSKIEWTHHTFNPWRGCTKVSPGCTNCYAETLSHRNPGVLGVWGDKGTRVIASDAAWREPLKWDRAAAAAGERHRVFCASLADVFEDRPELVEPRVRLFNLIQRTPNLDWLLLTKRPENWRRCWPLVPVPGHVRQNEGDGKDWQQFPNVWLGVSVEDQKRADERIPHLLKTPAAVRFLSVEPLLSAVDLTRLWLGDKTGWWNALDGRLTCKAVTPDGQEFWCETEAPIVPAINWVIVGGESGPKARPMHLDWARSIVQQCKAAAAPVFVKQIGADPRFNEADIWAGAVDKRYDKKGGDWSLWPSDLCVREFPRVPVEATP